LQQWYEGRREDEESNDLTITGNARMSLQEQVANGEWSGHDLAEEENATAAIEHRVDGVICIAVGTMTEWWRRINWIDGGARAKGAAANNGRHKCRRYRNVKAHSWTQLQEPRNGGEALLFESGQRGAWAPRAVEHTGVRLQRCDAQLGAHADRIAIKGNERLINALARFECTNERKGSGIGAISGWGCQSLALGPTLHKDAPLSYGDELIK
jgi:hypothetical protein